MGKLTDNQKIEAAKALYDLDTLDRQILKFMTQYPKASCAAVAEYLGTHRNTIQQRRAKPAFKRAWEELTATTERHLKEAAKRAAIKLKKWVDHEDPEIAEPYIKMALAKYLNKSEVDLTVQQKIRYKTTVQADGSLLQEVMEQEAAHGE